MIGKRKKKGKDRKKGMIGKGMIGKGEGLGLYIKTFSLQDKCLCGYLQGNIC